MVRISKDPEVRKLELIEAALALFREHGCEQTSVSDIVKKVGVAQGTFYYYFQSKDDVLNAAIDHYLRDHLEKMVRQLIADDSKNATQKLQLVIDASLSLKNGERSFVEYLHTEENASFRHKFMAKSNAIFIPLITQIVEQGVGEGSFHVRYPHETVELLMAMFGHLHDRIALSSRPEDCEKIARAAEEIAAKALGAREGSIRLAP
jgi:AcrR family transcriptional regulator